MSLASSTGAKTGLSVLLVAYLHERGYPLGRAALLAGAVGAVQVAGRLLVTALRGRVAEHRGYAIVFVGQAVGCALPLATTGHGGAATMTVLAFVTLFGLGFGLPELLRGTVVVDYYGVADYPRINGALSVWVVAAGPPGRCSPGPRSPPPGATSRPCSPRPRCAPGAPPRCSPRTARTPPPRERPPGLTSTSVEVLASAP
ncbi:MAG TPA: hypothetical protein VGH99_10250 [Pseudonocardia sp.]